MVQQVKAPATKLNDLGSIPRTYTVVGNSWKLFSSLDTHSHPEDREQELKFGGCGHHPIPHGCDCEVAERCVLLRPIICVYNIFNNL